MTKKPTFEELEQRIKKLETEASKRKQAEEALRKSETLLTETGQMAKVGGWEVDTKTLEVSWTEEIYRIYELPFGQQPSLEETIIFFHPNDRPKLETAIQKALDHGEPYDFEIRFITAKGKHLWTHTICKPITVDGKTVKLTGTFQDITDRKQAEEALRESEGKYRRIYDNIIDAYYEANIDGTILEISPSIEKHSKYKRKELIGKSLYDVYTKPEERNKLIAALINDGSVNEYELNLTDKDGTQHICFIVSIYNIIIYSAVFSLAFPQRFLRLLAVGNVLKGPGKFDCLTIHSNRLTNSMSPQMFALGCDQSDFHVVRLSMVKRFLNSYFQFWTIMGMEKIDRFFQ